MGEGREGDWECGSCRNRNYAFRSFCNRCKQPRLLVDTTSPADSKWLPRIGDWICTGCSNNNYASREKCKKCGEPKEVAAMPAIAMPGASLPTYAHYFARAHGGPGFKMNFGIAGSSTLQHPLPANSNWFLGGENKFGLHQTATWPLGINNVAGFPYAHNPNQLPMVPKGWRSGDWMCHCGFHNYSSRSQCKKCNASLPSAVPSSIPNSTASDLFPLSPSLNFGRSPHSTLEEASKHGTHSSYPALGTKRLASEEFVNEWDNKRLNAGDIYNQALPNVQQRSFQGYEHIVGSSNVQTPGLYTSYPNASSGSTAGFQMHMQSPQLAAMPTILGKGAKQWRDGDWMCTSCNNHNFASRSHCNSLDDVYQSPHLLFHLMDGSCRIKSNMHKSERLTPEDGIYSREIFLLKLGYVVFRFLLFLSSEVQHHQRMFVDF